MANHALQGTGIWAAGFRFGEDTQAIGAAVTAEELGYSALWLPDVGGDDLFPRVAALLRATSRITVATGVLNLWMRPPDTVANHHAELNSEFEGRFLLGIGVSNAQFVEQAGVEYQRPMAKTREFLDRLDSAPKPVPTAERVLGAVGPAMLRLAAERTAGAHPYLVTVDHTREARGVLGPGKVLAPEIGVVLETDPATARAKARAFLALYLELPILRNMLRFGFTEEDLVPPGSDRLVDALVSWGDEDAIAARLQEHRDAGADHLAIQVHSGDPAGSPTLQVDQWRRLAAIL
jgi:probable F420-dependent oxidoreductase